MAHRNNNNTNNNGQSVQKELGSETDAVEVIREDGKRHHHTNKKLAELTDRCEENGRYFRHKSTLEHELQGRIAPAPASAFEHGMNSSLWQTSDLSAATIMYVQYRTDPSLELLLIRIVSHPPPRLRAGYLPRDNIAISSPLSSGPLCRKT